MGRLELSTAAFGGAELAVFDRAHLQQYTMENPQLEREVVDLFLLQLPDILQHLAASSEPKDWKLWAHTLKGSAVAVGADRIGAMAVTLEKSEYQEPSVERGLRLAELNKLVSEFKMVAAGIYPQGA